MIAPASLLAIYLLAAPAAPVSNGGAVAVPAEKTIAEKSVADKGLPAAPAVLPPDSPEHRLIRRKTSPAQGTTQPVATGARANSFDTVRVALSLGAVLGLIFLFRWAGKKFAVPGAGTGAVQVVGRTVLAARQQVLLLRVGKRLLVVGDCGGSMSTLCELTDADEIALLLAGQRGGQGAAGGGLFGRMLNRNTEELEGDEPDGPPSDAVTATDPVVPEVESTRRELAGLREKIRFVSEQFGRKTHGGEP